MNYLKGFPKRYKDSVTPTGIEWWEGYNNVLLSTNNGGLPCCMANTVQGKHAWHTRSPRFAPRRIIKRLLGEDLAW